MKILLTRASERNLPLKGKVRTDESLVEINRYITSMYCAAEAVKIYCRSGTASRSYVAPSSMRPSDMEEGAT